MKNQIMPISCLLLGITCLVISITSNNIAINELLKALAIIVLLLAMKHLKEEGYIDDERAS